MESLLERDMVVLELSGTVMDAASAYAWEAFKIVFIEVQATMEACNSKSTQAILTWGFVKVYRRDAWELLGVCC
jgi:hypothetical protein